MSEYIERGALIEKRHKVCEYDEAGFCVTYQAVPVEDIQQAPAADVVELPCKIGTHLWRVTHPYRQEPKVTEFVVKNFRTVGKKHRLQLEVQAVNVPGTNWMAFSSFKRTYEEAEMELMKMDGGADK
jgi:hypothetical protein